MWMAGGAAERVANKTKRRHKTEASQVFFFGMLCQSCHNDQSDKNRCKSGRFAIF